LIVDEVDNIIVDSRVNTTYLFKDERITTWLNKFYDRHSKNRIYDDLGIP
jgi:hypothetical protein